MSAEYKDGRWVSKYKKYETHFWKILKEKGRYRAFNDLCYSRGYTSNLGWVGVFDDKSGKHSELRSKVARFQRTWSWFCLLIKQLLCSHPSWIINGRGTYEMDREEASKWRSMWSDKQDTYLMMRINWTCKRCGKFDYRFVDADIKL